MNRDDAMPTVKSKPGPRARNWVKFHLRHAAPTTYHTDFVWDRAKWAQGPFCTDVDGNVILDFISHVGSSPLGYNHPRVAELVHSMRWVDPDRYAGADFITAYGDKPSPNFPTPSHLHQKVHQITKHLGMNQAFFTNSGAEAVENAIKICYDKQKNNGYGFAFDGAFHGRTLGALSLNRSKTVQRKWFPQIPKVVDFPFCGCKKKCTCSWNIIGRDGRPVNKMAQTLDKRMGTIDPKEVAYIILEPVQGEGGYHFPNQNFVNEVFEIARGHDIPLIADEVQSGMGKTGKWWAIEHYKQKPDVLATAKAMRVGATVSSNKLFPDEDGRLSSTWGEGNAMASAVAYKTIEVIQKDNLLANAKKQGRYFLKRLEQIARKYSFVSKPRGLGLMLAMTIDTPKRRKKILKEAFKQGVLLDKTGFRGVRFLPPLDVTGREIDLAMDALDLACRRAR